MYLNTKSLSQNSVICLRETRDIQWVGLYSMVLSIYPIDGARETLTPSWL